MAKITYIPLYLSDEETLQRLPDEAVGRLIRCLLHFAATGEIPDLDVGDPVFYLWPMFQGIVERHIEAYEKKCEQNRENRAKAGKQAETPRTEEAASKAKPEHKRLCEQKSAEMAALFGGNIGQ